MNALIGAPSFAAYTPIKTKGQIIEYLVVGDDMAELSCIWSCRPCSVHCALISVDEGRTDRLCSDKMQYSDTAAW